MHLKLLEVAYFRVEGSCGCAEERFPVIHVDRYRDVIQELHSLAGSFLERMGDGSWVDTCEISDCTTEMQEYQLTLRQKLLSSSKQASSKDDNTGRSVSCFNVLSLR